MSDFSEKTDEGQKVLDEAILTNIEGELFRANLAILENLVKILEILTDKSRR